MTEKKQKKPKKKKAAEEASWGRELAAANAEVARLGAELEDLRGRLFVAEAAAAGVGGLEA